MDRTIKSFAFLPTKLTNGKIIWLKKFMKDQKEEMYLETYIHSGLFYETHSKVPFIAYRWETIKKYELD